MSVSLLTSYLSDAFVFTRSEFLSAVNIQASWDSDYIAWAINNLNHSFSHRSQDQACFPDWRAEDRRQGAQGTGTEPEI